MVKMPSAMPGGAGAFPQVVLLLLTLLVKFGTCTITLSALRQTFVRYSIKFLTSRTHTDSKDNFGSHLSTAYTYCLTALTFIAFNFEDSLYIVIVNVSTCTITITAIWISCVRHD